MVVATTRNVIMKNGSGKNKIEGYWNGDVVIWNGKWKDGDGNMVRHL